MRSLNLILLLLLCPIFCIAQKLPHIQEVSLRAPANIKIDGKASEWSNKFQAYNPGTEVYYAISNDDENLYLIVKASGALVARKIIAGGLTFTVYPSKDKKDKMTVSFPVFDRKDWPNIDLKQIPAVTKTSIADSVDVWIFIDKINRELSDKSKDIGIEGITGMDNLISVYNENGIKAAAKFDDWAEYIYELAIPLKYLGLSTRGKNAFDYNIKLNGSDHAEGAFIENIEGGIRVTGAPVKMSDMRFFWTPTDLSGIYTLAKKP